MALDSNPKDLEKMGGNLAPQESVAQGVILDSGHLNRRLENRQIQLIAIGGSIGTGLFISIGSGLHTGGPATLLLAFVVYCFFVGLVNNSMAEMITQYPVAGGFIRLAGHFVGEAFGFMAGWNFFIYEALVIPFEISALAIVVKYWSDSVPIWSMCLACIILYALINCLVVSAYGETEFWLSGGKVILIFALFLFTFITMVGGNPRNDAYGFRHWTEPSPFVEYRSSDDLGRWEGFLSALWIASFCVVGPEYISLVAAEAKHPRIYLKAAYKTIYFRFAVFFIGSALAVGTVLASNDPTLVSILVGSGSGGGTAAASPYVIAMKNLGITVFPDVVNALLITSIFSAGNSYVYCASRSLHSLAIEGRAPAIFGRVNRFGVPIYSLMLTMAFACLSFLQASEKTSRALGILINLVTGGAFINYLVMALTYVYFHRALTAQGVERKSLPYYGRFQPYCGYVAVVYFTFVILAFGYTSLSPFDVESFFGCYTMAFLSFVLFVAWTIFRRSNFKDPHQVDLLWERTQVDAYETTTQDVATTFWKEMMQLVKLKGNSK